MINPEIAAWTRSQLIPEEFANFHSGPEGRIHTFKVKEVKDYSIIVESKLVGSFTQLLELAINKSELYRKEYDAVNTTRLPAPPELGKSRGRPPGSTNKAKEQPMPTNETNISVDTSKISWIPEAMEEAARDFTGKLQSILDRAITESLQVEAANTNAGSPEGLTLDNTCVGCTNADKGPDGTQQPNGCKLYGTVPIFVVVDAVNQCQSYNWNEGIPF